MSRAGRGASSQLKALGHRLHLGSPYRTRPPLQTLTTLYRPRDRQGWNFTVGFLGGKTGAPWTPSRPSSPVSLSRQLIFPDLVEGLVLMNIDPNGKGWIDWAATKVSAVHLEGGGAGGAGRSQGQGRAGGLERRLLNWPLPGPQLSGLTSTLPDTVLSHLFSQVRVCGTTSCRSGVAGLGTSRRAWLPGMGRGAVVDVASELSCRTPALR